MNFTIHDIYLNINKLKIFSLLVLKSIIPLKAACKKAFRGSLVQTVLLVKRPLIKNTLMDSESIFKL